MDTAWFKARKKQLKVSDEKLAAAIGRDRTTVTKVINGDVRFDLAFVEGFASVLDVSPEDVLEHVGVALEAGRVAPSAKASAPENASRRQVSDQPVTRSVGGGEVVLIPRLDLSLPMGPGATVDDYVEEEPVAFDIGYLRAFTRTPPHRLRLAAGAGDSMFPTLVPNDLVWIDTTQNQLLHADRIYAASINGGAAIKRLRPVAGGSKVLVISDNKTVEPYEVDAQDVVIWGRVIRFARDL
jgi:phage repressor protein C with HTH and peptisase S24 domain